MVDYRKFSFELSGRRRRRRRGGGGGGDGKAAAVGLRGGRLRARLWPMSPWPRATFLLLLCFYRLRKGKRDLLTAAARLPQPHSRCSRQKFSPYTRTKVFRSIYTTWLYSASCPDLCIRDTPSSHWSSNQVEHVTLIRRMVVWRRQRRRRQWPWSNIQRREKKGRKAIRVVAKCAAQARRFRAMQ